MRNLRKMRAEYLELAHDGRCDMKYLVSMPIRIPDLNIRSGTPIPLRGPTPCSASGYLRKKIQRVGCRMRISDVGADVLFCSQVRPTAATKWSKSRPKQSLNPSFSRTLQAPHRPIYLTRTASLIRLPQSWSSHLTWSTSVPAAVPSFRPMPTQLNTPSRWTARMNFATSEMNSSCRPRGH